MRVASIRRSCAPTSPAASISTTAPRGRASDAKGTLNASFSGLSGKLRGATASGAGTVTHAGQTWEFSNLRVGLGSATLALDGHIDDRMELRFALSAQDLNLLSPGSRGQLKASGTLGGTFSDPAIVGVAHALDIDYQGIKLKAFDADVDFEPDAAGKESKIDAQLHVLTYAQRTLNAATLTLRGPPSAYTVHLTASAPGIAAAAQAQGAYSAGTFKGQLTMLALSGNESLHLALDRPVGLLAAADHVRIEWLCLVGAPGSVCADAEWTPATWSTTVMTNELPLATLTAGMTPEVQYLGTISALAHLSGGATTPLLGSLRAQLANAEIAHRLASKKVEHTRIGSGTFSVTLAPTTISTQSDIDGGEVGTLHGAFTAQRTTPEWQNMPVSGELHILNADCSIVSLYVPDIDRASGHFNADMRVSGTIGAPRLAGQLKVSAGELDVYQTNLALRAIALEAHLSDGGLDFKGSANAGTGTVNADGHLEWRDLLPYGKFHLQGTNLRVADIPEAQIDASPDLDFDHHRTQDRSHRQGTGAVRQDRAQGHHQRRACLGRRSDRRRRGGGSEQALRGHKRHRTRARRSHQHRHARPHRQARGRSADPQWHRCHHARSGRAQYREWQVHGLRPAARHPGRQALSSTARSTIPASRSPRRRSSRT